MLLAPRHLPHLAAIVGLLTRYGLGDLARQNGLHGLVPAAATDADDAGEEGGTSAEKAAALQKVANRIFSGVVLAGLVVASAMLLPHQRTLGTTGFVLAAAIGLWMVLTILWTDRQRE